MSTSIAALTPLRSVAAVLLAAFALPSSATVVIVPELPELTAAVDVIAHVQVAEQAMVEEQGRIWTRTTLRVVDGLKGAKAADTLVVHQLGGRVGDRQMWIPGAYRFEKGRELMFFGTRWQRGGAGAVIPYGVGYGVFEVGPDDSGRIVVAESIGDIVAYKRNADGTRSPFKPVPRSWDSVEAFKSEIRGLLTATEKGVGLLPPRVVKPAPKIRGGAL